MRSICHRDRDDGSCQGEQKMNRLTKISFVFLALLMAFVATPRSATAQIQIFSTGQYGTPETISLAPPGFGFYGGSYFIPDARLAIIWVVPPTGGPPTMFPAAPGVQGL